jgi:hypothetical protein
MGVIRIDGEDESSYDEEEDILLFGLPSPIFGSKYVRGETPKQRFAIRRKNEKDAEANLRKKKDEKKKEKERCDIMLHKALVMSKARCCKRRSMCREEQLAYFEFMNSPDV